VPDPYTPDVLQALGLQVVERGWLSSNTIMCAVAGAPTALIDTGYATHAALTLAMAEAALKGRGLDQIVNTHLHADHCGGNAILQKRYPGATTAVPEPSLAVVQRWDMDALTFARTDQRCERFAADVGMRIGETIAIGPTTWQIHAAKGHDHDAVMLFEPEHRVLIAGDALWERRLAIVFPELAGAEGFASNLETLALIERLNVALVIPGHGRPFQDVQGALAASRRRLQRYQADPKEHRYQAQRALLMFHMLEHQSRDEQVLVRWLQKAEIFQQTSSADDVAASQCIESLVTAGAVIRHEGSIRLPTNDEANGT
jgi:glyoxylase-like metal-dependent hydrolase (beta-lactamase superfamily II)